MKRFIPFVALFLLLACTESSTEVDDATDWQEELPSDEENSGDQENGNEDGGESGEENEENEENGESGQEDGDESGEENDEDSGEEIIIPDGYSPIYTADDLYNIQDDLSGSYILMNNISLSSYDIWTPIGPKSSSSFTGIFDGAGHTISDLTTSGSYYVGLFGSVDGGSISNLFLKDYQVAGNMYAGAICGQLKSGSITACGLEDGSVEGYSVVGGIVGYAWAVSNIVACYNAGSVDGSDGIGGIIGATGTDDSTVTNVTACYNSGSITGSTGVGGVVGYVNSYNKSYLTGCYNCGSVVGSVSIGGITSYTSSAEVVDCYNIAAVEYRYGTSVRTLSDLNEMVSNMNNAAGSDYYTVNSGNIIPSLMGEQISYEDVYASSYTEHIYIESAADLKALRDIVNYNNGWSPKAVTITADIDLNGEEWTPIYNFLGTFDGGGHTITGLTINNSSTYYQGLLGYTNGATIKNIVIKEPQIVGRGSVGAVCGMLDGESTISNCGVVGGSIAGDYTVGGVVGHAATITSCYNSSTVEGKSMVGGIAGVTSNDSPITACYNIGLVVGSSNYVGGVIGQSQSPIIACYSSGSIEGDKSIGGVVGETLSTIISCYNSGSVTGSSEVGGIVGNSFYYSPTGCYYLPYSDTIYSNSDGEADENLVATMTSSDFPATLNLAAGDNYFEFDTNNYNGGYPILSAIDYSALD